MRKKVSPRPEPRLTHKGRLSLTSPTLSLSPASAAAEAGDGAHGLKMTEEGASHPGGISFPPAGNNLTIEQ